MGFSIGLIAVALTACQTVAPVEEGLTRTLLAAQTTLNNPAGEGYSPAAQTDRLILEVNPDTTDIRVTVKDSGYVWSTATTQAGDNTRYPIFSLTYRDSKGSLGYMDSLTDCVSRGQYRITNTDTGVKVEYTLGTVLKTFIFPIAMAPERYEMFYQKANDDQKSLLEMIYRLIDFSEYDEATVLELQAEYPQAVNKKVYGLRNKTMNDVLKLEVATLFEELGYTKEDRKLDGLSQQEEKTEEQPVFNLNVYYTLEDDQLVIRVPQTEIEMPSTIRLETLSLPTNFTGGEDKDGYFLLPDGSGSIMNYKNGKSESGAYRVQLFGPDYAVSRQNLIAEANEARLNVYGCREGNEAYLAVVEDSQAYAYVNAVTGTEKQTARVWPEFTISVVDYMTSAGKTSTSDELTMAVYPEERYTGDIRLRYKFLSGDKASYSGMAAWYREYLFGDAPLKEADEYPLTVETVGLIREKKYRFGFSYSVDNVLTDFTQSASIIEELRSAGVEALNLRLRGWINGGYRQGLISTGIRPEKALGGVSGLQALADKLQSMDVGFYPDAQILYADAQTVGNSLSRKKTVTMLNHQQGLLYLFDSAIFIRTTEKDRFILNSSQVNAGSDSIKSFLKGVGVNAVSLGSAGSDLNADYTSGETVHRQDSIEAMAGLLDRVKNDGTDLMISDANAYALPYADVVTNIPLRSERYVMTDYSVPFYAMVLSGHVQYTSPAVNVSNGERSDLLRVMENGAAPLYVLTAESLVNKSAGDYPDLYATQYATQKTRLLSEYEELNSAVGSLYGTLFLRHEQVADQVFVSVFSDGYVYVNYNNYPVKVNGYEIPALGWWTGRGDPK